MEYGIEYVDLSGVSFVEGLLAVMPDDVTREFSAIPLASHRGCTLVAVPVGTELKQLDEISRRLEGEVEFRVADAIQLRQLIERFYPA